MMKKFPANNNLRSQLSVSNKKAIIRTEAAVSVCRTLKMRIYDAFNMLNDD